MVSSVRDFWNFEIDEVDSVTVDHLFVEQVRRTPNLISVEFSGRSLTYQELDDKANQLANEILDSGVSAGELVGVCMDRSIEMIVAVIGILKSGAGIVPLDPNYPLNRIRFMVADSGISKVILGKNYIATELRRAFDRLELLAYDLDRTTQISSICPNTASNSESIAYCIYTSGSTGKPKGVEIQHSALANLIAWHKNAWLSDPGTRILLYSPISFDVAFHEIFAGLCTGGTLIQVDEPTRVNAMTLLEYVSEKKIEKWYMSFVTLQQVAYVAQKRGYPNSLKELIIGGEPLRITPEIRTFASETACTVRNNYGSTECLTVATYTLKGDPDSWPLVAPIGKPNVFNTNVYLLDSQLKPVPIGEVGDIYVDGACLAQGYRNRKQLNAERFIKSPYKIHGDYLYKTLDLGKYLPDGNIVCLGRTDNQVKIGGMRVELSEVEAQISEDPAITQCSVVAQSNEYDINELFAYIVLDSKAVNNDDVVLENLFMRLRKSLPSYMVPKRIKFVEQLPITPSGKVDLKHLAKLSSEEEKIVLTDLKSCNTSDIEKKIATIWQELLGIQEVDYESSFFDMGGTSLMLTYAHERVEETLKVSLPATTLLRYPSVRTLSSYLLPKTLEQNSSRSAEATSEIAVVGISCRVPGAKNLEEFWSNLSNGVNSIEALSADEISASTYKNQDSIDVSSSLSDIDLFDAGFFGYSKKEAECIDPQQRIFLECGWEALENALIDPRSYRGRIGVFAGSSLSTYLVNNVLPNKLAGKPFLSHRHFDEASDLYIEQGNSRDHLTSRVSYKMNLTGPSVNIQATCATSLAAVHVACKSILNGECEVALAGGVSIIHPQKMGYKFHEGMMLSSDGVCRPFDKGSTGTVFGNGVGIVVLKSLEKALEDNDLIWGVIKGSALNNDGAQKLDYAAPSFEAQKEVIINAHQDAGVISDKISYVETHGTGTVLGDPIEVGALNEAFRSTSESKNTCYIGSVKSNIGHLDEASGVIGLIKTIMALHYKQIPPSINFSEPNPKIDFADSPFVVNTLLRKWETKNGAPRIAGVSSFGMGGTNCHLVLQESPQASDKNLNRPGKALLTVSAKTLPALKENLHQFSNFLNTTPASLSQVCLAANNGRQHFNHRVGVVAKDPNEARKRLLAKAEMDVFSVPGAEDRSLAFLFSGQGSQYRGIGEFLFENIPVFRQAIQDCEEILKTVEQIPLTELLYGEDFLLGATRYLQAVLFSVGYALSKMWLSWNVKPNVVAGHSIGEYMAAHVAGVFDLEVGLQLVAERGRLMSSLPQNGMMAQVEMAGTSLKDLLLEGVNIAAYNTSTQTVISGEKNSVMEMCKKLESIGVSCIPLNVTNAFHSFHMKPIQEEFQRFARQFSFKEPEIDIILNSTGGLPQDTNSLTADYWADHIVKPVNFKQSFSTMSKLGVDTYLELGPKSTLVALGKSCIDHESTVWLTSLAQNDEYTYLDTLSRLYEIGYSINWQSFNKIQPEVSPVRIPTYPFQRTRYWLPAKFESEEKSELLDCYDIAYQNAELEFKGKTTKKWLVVGERNPLLNGLLDKLNLENETVEYVESWSNLGPSDADAVCRRMGRERGDLHVVALVDELGAIELPISTEILYNQTVEFLNSVTSMQPERVWFLAKNTSSSSGLLHSPLSGLCEVANREYPETLFTFVESACSISVLEKLGSLLSSVNRESFYRLDDKCEVSVRRLSARGTGQGNTLVDLPIKKEGEYLITGGTGGLGRVLALEVAKLNPKKIVLVGRKGLIRDQNQEFLDTIASSTEVSIEKADIANQAEIRSVISSFDNLKGVFQCAGILDDGVLAKNNREKSKRVFSPKVTGSWNLHLETENLDLDFFVMYSSTASLIGYAGQASYAASNSFLDALAHYRRSLNLPGLSINWGSWEGEGMHERLCAENKKKLQAEGESLVNPAAGISYLAQSLRQDLSQVAVTANDWTKSNKLDKSQILALVCGAEAIEDKDEESPSAYTNSSLEQLVTEEVKKLIGASEVFDKQVGFTKVGLDSLGAITLRSRLQNKLGIQLSSTVVFDYPCVNDLVLHLHEEISRNETEGKSGPHVYIKNPKKDDNAMEDNIAIVGMGCRFPQANNPYEFWELLANGQDTLRDIPADRWQITEYYDSDFEAPGKVNIRKASFIEEPYSFDSLFFGISPREALYMNPSQRLLLEVTWEALENAGINPLNLHKSNFGVFVGADDFINDYALKVDRQSNSESHFVTGNTLSFSAGRISHVLGLQGPSMTLSTACSSSLVALHNAINAISQGDCEEAIVGGVKLILGPEEPIQLSQLKALAPDGRSKTFADNADGYGQGEGCGIVIVKRLSKALEEKNPIHAVIKGSAVNHDGASSGITVPNGQSQRELINKALDKAQVSPSQISYIEAHGTGTQLGDPIELNALSKVFESNKDSLLVGSVKSQIGHLEEASGVAGLIKAVLCLQNKRVPAQLYSHPLNHNFEWSKSRIEVPTESLQLPESSIAGISSFGMSGTNAHVIIESYQRDEISKPACDKNKYLFVFSGRDGTDLRANVGRFFSFLTPEVSLYDAAYTLAVGRGVFDKRACFIVPNYDELRSSLLSYLENEETIDGVFIADGSKGQSGALREAAQEWQRGRLVDWKSLFKSCSAKLISLPTYSFKKNKLVLDKSPERNDSEEEQSEKNLGRKQKEVILVTDKDSSRDDIETKTRQYLVNALGLSNDEFDNDTPFCSIGADSLTYIKMSKFLQKEYDVSLSFQELAEENNTISKLVDSLKRRSPQKKSLKIEKQTKQVPEKPGSFIFQGKNQELSNKQKGFLQDFIKEYTARTRGSQQQAETGRPYSANCRMAPFKKEIKEVLYPIVAERSEGAAIWDIDGNRYLDISMGYGVHLLGHQPPAVLNSLLSQINKGLHIGPMTKKAGVAAKLLAEAVDLPRAVFCNSGTEAVMAALRFSRAATGKTKFVMFEGSYHGWADATLALPGDFQNALPVSRGISMQAMRDVTVLEYGSAESLEVIRSLGDGLAAVLVEPIQSRRPDLQPIEFLRQLREITSEMDCALIFDEVITGFRVHPGGFQAWSGIKADLAVYGKVIGGGLPVGAVAGEKKYLDAIDGGNWNYRDQSVPEAPTTFFGGTFNRNPLSMAACESVLKHLKNEGPGLQEQVSALVTLLAKQLNLYFESENFPVKIIYFSSCFRFIVNDEYSLQRFSLETELFFYLMISKGIYILETRVSFLSASHTPDDVEYLVATAKECCELLRANDFFPLSKKEVNSSDLLKEIELPTEIVRPRSLQGRKHCKNILLTGSTGFLGGHFLKELIQQTDAKIHCLVRAKDEADGLARIAESASGLGCWESSYINRIAVVTGDLSLPNFGNKKTYEELTKRIDSIFHNGAYVNSLYSYLHLKATNVDGTLCVLKLASERRPKMVHYVSSDAIFESSAVVGHDGFIDETSPLILPENFYGGGYAKSKWVADNLVQKARHSGIAAHIYRPTTILGIYRRPDFLIQFLKGCIQLKMAPNVEAIIDFVPVDFVSKLIVGITTRADLGDTFHIAHPNPILYSDLFKKLKKSTEIQLVPYERWYEALNSADLNERNPLYNLLPIFGEAYTPIFRNSQLGVENMEFAMQALDQKVPLIEKIIDDYFEENQLFD